MSLLYILVLKILNTLYDSPVFLIFCSIGAVASIRGCGREAAAVLFWVHIFAVFSMAGWIVLYIHILF